MKIAVSVILACAAIPVAASPDDPIVLSAGQPQVVRPFQPSATPVAATPVPPPQPAMRAASAAQPVNGKPDSPKSDGVQPPPAKPAAVADAAKPATPKNEVLHFNLNWPSGLSLGEGELSSTLTPEGWRFAMKLDAAVPAFPIAETATSHAGADLCSTDLVKEATRGRRKVGEKTTFDAAKLTATRKTTNVADGGKTEMRINACAKDALTFIQFVRRELAAGRIPQAQPVYYGAGYQTRVQYVGTQRVKSGSDTVEADKLTAFVKGPASEFTVDLLFARDAARTPVSVTIPVAIGKFTVEFER